jgi:hypothetical protein
VFVWAACGAVYVLLVALAYVRFHAEDARALID